MSMGAADDVTENIVNRHLDLARAEIISYQGNSSVTVDAITCTQEDIQVGALVNEKGILDPIKRRKKGDTNSRLKSSLEKMKKRKRKYHMTLPQLPVQASKPPFVGGAENFDPNWMSERQSLREPPAASFSEVLRNKKTDWELWPDSVFKMIAIPLSFPSIQLQDELCPCR
ncbi:hypothetical protein ACH5RR_001529 [Cinchona calisaya]|uniref:Uncharacterized protein n=1 Tax=Cinchona calisaya TaxID=153742 RepID=A0ABD3B3S0_9GENT